MQLRIVIQDHTITVHFLVVGSSIEGEASHWSGCPVVIACNTLNLLNDYVSDPKHTDTSAWSATLRWNQIRHEPESQEKAAVRVTRPVVVRTGRSATTLFPGEVHSISCFVRAVEQLKGKTASIEGLGDGSLVLGSACRVVYTFQHLVGNTGQFRNACGQPSASHKAGHCN